MLVDLVVVGEGEVIELFIGYVVFGGDVVEYVLWYV